MIVCFSNAAIDRSDDSMAGIKIAQPFNKTTQGRLVGQSRRLSAASHSLQCFN